LIASSLPPFCSPSFLSFSLLPRLPRFCSLS
jgi:hypothetical protein